MIEPRYEAGVWGGDGARNIHLGTHTAASRRRVLWWLRTQALRLADGLDPDPARTPHSGAVTPVTPVPGRDAPTVLRRWAADAGRQDEAARYLAAGFPFRLAVRDGDGCWYELRAHQTSRLARLTKRKGTGKWTG